MKKLIIAMSAATMAALYAQAGQIGITEGFEGRDTGRLDVDEDDKGDTTGVKYWSRAEGKTGDSEVKAYAEAPTAGNTKFLAVDETDVLTRSAGTSTKVTADTGVVVSTKVRFTAADQAPEAAPGDKILVWAKAPDEGTDGPAKLMVTALGTDESDTETFGKAKAYDTGVTVTTGDDDWYDLEITAQAADANAASPIVFTVKLDETVIKGSYLSLVLTDDEGDKTISSIGFQGTGKVDDIAFSTFTEAVVETFSFSATVNDVYDSQKEFPSFASATYSIDGGTPVSFGETLSSLKVPTTAKTITLAVTVYDDAKLSNTGAVKGKAVEFEDGTAYVWTLDVDVTGMKKDDTKSVTLTIEKIGGGTPSINPAAGDDTISITADTKEAAEAAAIAAITVPTGVDAATYKAYFKATAALQDDGTYTVTVGLNPDVVTPAVVDDANLDIAAGAITVSSKAGLYYSLVNGTTLSTITNVVDTQAGTGTVLKLVDSTMKGDAAFYKVSVTAVTPATTETTEE